MGAAAGLIALAAALFAAGFAILRANRRERETRRDILKSCGELLESSAAQVAPSGYGVLRGVYHGRRAALTPIAEALAFRKLPQLWIAAALADIDPDRPSIEIVRRPAGSEFFMGAAGSAPSVRPPASWPQDTSVRVSRSAAPLLRSIGPLLAGPLSDPKLKSVSIGPRGVRVVRQAAQGARGAYVLFRDMRFDADTICAADARSALDLATALADRIAAHDIEIHDAAKTRDAA
ncbi:hypothetical protein [Methylopila sp. M107]|uniref:hypothetical protein n=1 Tax=Methylopila sp. M107 TaxID=1101190 RepID=UPI00037B95EB|nr:hypothetical protein [Methylopila sp. M107]